MITIACVLRNGGKVGYDSTWVDKLKNSVERNLTLPHRFVCLSDIEVNCARIPLENTGPGYWAKIQLFKPNLFNTPVLYLDLDTVICNNIDDMVASLMSIKTFLMWQDRDFNLDSSAIMFWHGDYSFIYEKYIKDPTFYEEKYIKDPNRLVGDQGLICQTVEHKFINDIFPDDWFQVVKKRNNINHLSAAKFLIFRKAHTKPSTMLNHPLIINHWK